MKHFLEVMQVLDHLLRRAGSLHPPFPVWPVDRAYDQVVIAHNLGCLLIKERYQVGPEHPTDRTRRRSRPDAAL